MKNVALHPVALMAMMLAGCVTVGNPSLLASTVAVPKTWSNAATPSASSQYSFCLRSF
jgi:hypothetical protein